MMTMRTVMMAMTFVMMMVMVIIVGPCPLDCTK